MRLFKLIVTVSAICIFNSAIAQQKTCCTIVSCKEQAAEYAVRVTGIVNYLGTATNTVATDNATLSAFKTQRPELYEQFVRIVKELDKMFFANAPLYGDADCFSNALPTVAKANVMGWVNHVRLNVLNIKPKFPSTEFCVGWKKRIELAQGAAAFLSKTRMAYLGSLRGYLMYTFKGKEKCGGNFRLMAGPAFFLRSSNSYIALSSRLSIRLTDLRAKVFSLGNLNFAGGYNTNFDGFNYAEAGFEAELGPFGFNILGNYNIDNKKPGFLIGIIFANKKL